MVYTLDLLPEAYAVCRIEAGNPVPFEILEDETLASITVTREQVSIVCREERAPRQAQAEMGWRALRVAGSLDFTLTGVLQSLTAPLARAQVSIFALSTYDTDYLLVPSRELRRELRRGIEALEACGYEIR